MGFRAYFDRNPNKDVQLPTMCLLRPCDVNRWLRYTDAAINGARLHLLEFGIGVHITTCPLGGDLVLINFEVTPTTVYVQATTVLVESLPG